MKKLLLTFIIFAVASSSYACEFESLPQISIATSLDNERSFNFNEKQSFHDKSIIRAFNCQKVTMANQFLMIGLGPEIVEFDDSIRSFSFTDNLRESKACTIKDAPTKLMSFEEKKAIFKKKKAYFNKCLEVFIEDEGRQKMNIKTEQKGCSVNKITENRASVSGGFCFVKPNFTSTFLIKLRVKKECQSYAGLKKLNIQPMDLKGNLNFYIAGDDTGHSTQLTAIESIPLRVLTSASEKFMPATDDYGLDYPRFPLRWIDTEPMMAKPDIQDRGDRILFKTKFWVDNRCESKCEGGMCFGECDFATPVTANISLKVYNKKKKKFEYLTSWVDGGVAQPYFQGILNGLGFDIPIHYINETDLYRLEYEFDDPKFDFEKFKNNIKRRYGRIEQHLPRLGRSEIAAIPNINQIQEQALLPQIREIQGLNFDQELNGIASALDTLRQYLNYKIWPPYFGELCDKTKSSCRDIRKNYINMKLDFKFVRNDENFDIDIKEFVKKSLFNKEIYKTTKLPAFKCGY